MTTITDQTPIAMLTVGQLKEILSQTQATDQRTTADELPKYVYGIAGIASLFNCSLPTANRIKASGQIDPAITQIGRKIMVDADLALRLANQATRGGKR